jgi:UDP-N-acetylmuramate: L-alanyl-gamma-D-glutamyl-meso-diaminopimelate ligase
VPKSGRLVAPRSDETVRRLILAEAQAPVSFFDVIANGEAPDTSLDWAARLDHTDQDGSHIDLYRKGQYLGRMVSPLIGEHNLRNTLAALAAVADGFGIEPDVLARGLASFQGIKRRQELLGTPGGIALYDDFAHHPTAVRETLAALRARYPNQRLIAVFEPRSATACRRQHQNEYPSSFAAADDAWLAPLGRSNLAEDERLDLALLADAIRKNGQRARVFESVDAIVEAVTAEAQSGDVVALLSNGAFGGIYERLLEDLARPHGNSRA